MLFNQTKFEINRIIYNNTTCEYDLAGGEELASAVVQGVQDGNHALATVLQGKFQFFNLHRITEFLHQQLFQRKKTCDQFRVVSQKYRFEMIS